MGDEQQCDHNALLQCHFTMMPHDGSVVAGCMMAIIESSIMIRGRSQASIRRGSGMSSRSTMMKTGPPPHIRAVRAHPHARKQVRVHERGFTRTRAHARAHAHTQPARAEEKSIKLTNLRIVEHCRCGTRVKYARGHACRHACCACACMCMWCAYTSACMCTHPPARPPARRLVFRFCGLLGAAELNGLEGPDPATLCACARGSACVRARARTWIVE